MLDTPARETLPAPEPDDLARFGQFIHWLTVAVFTFGSLELLGALIFQQPWIGAAGGLSLGYGACLLWARHILWQGRLRAAVMLTSVGLLALILVGAPVLPTIYAALLLLPFVVVALALPFLPARQMRWLILMAWLVGVLIAVTGSLAPSSLVLPDWIATIFRIGAVAAALGLAFLLLWQYARRLNDTLTQSQAANRELLEQVARRAQAEAELSHERNRLRALIDNVPDFIYAKDTASRFTLANRASAGILGRTPAELAGKTDFDLRPTEDAAQFRADEQSVMQSGQTMIDREEQVFINGQERWLLTTMVPVRDDNGVVTGLVGISRDISERKQSEEQLQGRLAELEAVNRVSKELRTAESMDEMLSVWLDVTLEVMRANSGSIWLHDPANDELVPVLTRGWIEPAGAGPIRPQRPAIGVQGNTFSSGQPYISSDFHADPNVDDDTRQRLPPGGGASIPIPVGDQVIGTFCVSLPFGQEVTPGNVSLLMTLAAIAGSALQRMRYYAKMEERLGQLSALRAIDVTISSSIDLRVTLAVVLEQVVSQLNVAAADILLFNPTRQTLEFAQGRGFGASNLSNLQLPLSDTHAGQVVLERRVLILADMRAAAPSGWRTTQLVQDGFIGYAGAPLVAQGQMLGVLELFQRAPFQPDPAWVEFLEALAGQAAIALDNSRLFENLQQNNQELIVAYDRTIEGWSAALDLRDKETEGHSQRVTELTIQLAVTLGFTPEQLVHVRRGALLHDIGKMGIPDSILLKPGPLTEDEWAIMRQHPLFAHRLLAPIEFLRPALDIPFCHHEHWDGTGYPQGLKGDQIPLAARVFAVVDVWDALRSDRAYRTAWTVPRVLEYIRQQSGTGLDPQVVEAYLGMMGDG
jgi:PAS domain S-box-containing protein